MRILDPLWCWFVLMIMLMVVVLIAIFTSLTTIINQGYTDRDDALQLLCLVVAISLIIWSFVSRINDITKRNVEKNKYKLFKEKIKECTDADSFINAAIDSGFSRTHKLVKWLDNIKNCNNCKCAGSVVLQT